MGRNANRKRARSTQDEDSDVVDLSCPQCGTFLPFVHVGRSSMVHVAHLRGVAFVYIVHVYVMLLG